MTGSSQGLDIEATVNRIMVEEFEVEADSLRPDSLLGEDLGLDSLDGVDLVVALEKAFKCRIAESEAREIRTLSDIYQQVRQRLESAAGEGA